MGSTTSGRTTGHIFNMMRAKAIRPPAEPHGKDLTALSTSSQVTCKPCSWFSGSAGGIAELGWDAGSLRLRTVTISLW